MDPLSFIGNRAVESMQHGIPFSPEIPAFPGLIVVVYTSQGLPALMEERQVYTRLEYTSQGLLALMEERQEYMTQDWTRVAADERTVHVALAERPALDTSAVGRKASTARAPQHNIQLE
jgi:uncharacterized membrane protein